MLFKGLFEKVKGLVVKGKDELIKIVNEIGEDEEIKDDVIFPWESEYLEDDIRISLKEDVMQMALV
jgi:hypothetical protein